MKALSVDNRVTLARPQWELSVSEGGKAPPPLLPLLILPPLLPLLPLLPLAEAFTLVLALVLALALAGAGPTVAQWIKYGAQGSASEQLLLRPSTATDPFSTSSPLLPLRVTLVPALVPVAVGCENPLKNDLKNEVCSGTGDETASAAVVSTECECKWVWVWVWQWV